MRRHHLCLLLSLLYAGCDDPGVPPGTDAGPPAPEPDAGSMTEPEGVLVESGYLGGTEIDGSEAFLGIPFAAPPVGDLRWRPPEPPQSWEGLRAADAMSAQCPQPTGTLAGDTDPDTPFIGEEDCLYLNVWTPTDRADDEPLPVMVFLHGGGNFLGSTSDPLGIVTQIDDGPPLYDGARVASRGGVVVVTLNYRLGALGFLTHEGLSAESDSGTSGNYGLLDQIAGLQWVQRNIAAFGGDPERVLLFGQSGGARDTLLLAMSPLTEGLFSRVIIHSGPLGAQDLASADAQGVMLVDEMGCADEPDPIACMRTVDPEALVLARSSLPLGLASGAFRPIIDRYVVPEQPFATLARGSHRSFPIMIGTTDAEYSHRWADMTDEAYPAAVAASVGPERAAATVAQYPLEAFADGREAYVTLMSDRNVSCPARRFARTAAAQDTTIYLYRFQQLLDPEVRLGFGAYHTSDLVYLFQHLDGESIPASDEDRDTQAVMLRYWTRFAATGDPNGGDDPTWTAFSGLGEDYLGIQSTPQPGQRLKEAECDFWDSQR